MIQSVRKKKKLKQDWMGYLGLSAIIMSSIFAFYIINKSNNPLDRIGCSIKNGPNSVTAIIFDKSDKYSTDQVTDIKTSFSLWLSGQKSPIKDRPVRLEYFSEGSLIQLYVTDQNFLNNSGSLQPITELCIPPDFKNAKGLIDNPEFLEANYKKFINIFESSLAELLEESEGKSPIMETFIRLSNSASFQKHPEKPHNLFIISDMLQSSSNYSHYRDGLEWNDFEKKMAKTVFLRPNFKGVNWQVFWAIRNKEEDKSLQGIRLVNFWTSFFKNADANNQEWMQIDG